MAAAISCPVLVAALALAEPVASDTPVIGFDLDPLDASGLYGPAQGRRTLDYAYCIPRGDAYRDEVQAIDPSARFMPGSRGRIGCGSEEVLTLGNTHQPGWGRVLESLAELPYVGRIERAWFE